MTEAPSVGQFTRAYRRGVTEELPPPPWVAARAAQRRAATGSFTLRGAVITPEGAWSKGYVTVADGVIAGLSRTKPSGIDQLIDTKGVILPGLIDLHGHPEFNVFAAWEPPRMFANRYRWRTSDIYHQLVRDPQNKLLEEVPSGTSLRYAEIRALAGGVTAIQGASGAGHVEPLVRNVDLWIFGAHRARAMIDLATESSRDWPRLQKVLADIAAGNVDAFYLHLCEGQRGDARSAAEFERFLAAGAATPKTVLIHAGALDSDGIHQIADAGCKLVWSPQSNLRLYGQTTLAAEAIGAGMPVALGADWLPSGSTSLLAEMKVARRELASQGLEIAAADLVAMVTSTAAATAGLGEHLGSLAVGRPADLLVLERHHDDPYENVCQADPSWVDLVTIGGDVTYARDDWYKQLTDEPASGEPLLTWGKSMRLDDSFGTPAAAPVPTLAEIRGLLTAAYPPVGPIYA